MIRLSATGLFLCLSRERPRFSKTEAVELLKRCLSDEATRSLLRTLAGSIGSDPIANLDDQRIIEDLASRIESGELLLFGEYMPAYAGGGGHAARSTPVVVPQRKARATQQAPQEQADDSLFPANADLAAMAAAMEGAADSGTPFCPT